MPCEALELTTKPPEPVAIVRASWMVESNSCRGTESESEAVWTIRGPDRRQRAAALGRLRHGHGLGPAVLGGSS